MSKLSDELLLESYYKAKDLNLCPEFICILEKEIQKRALLHHSNTETNKKGCPTQLK